MTQDLKPNEKYCLTVTEAAQYSAIGENRIRAIMENDPTLDWILTIGSHKRIKRPQFELWINSVSFI